MEEKEYQEMIKDWQIDESDLSAVHVSGLKMKFIEMKDDKFRTHVEGFKNWATAEVAMAKEQGREITSEQIQQKYIGLGSQFAEIIKHLKSASKEKTPSQQNGKQPPLSRSNQRI